MRLAAVLFALFAILCAPRVYAVDMCAANFGNGATPRASTRSMQHILGNSRLMDRLLSTNDAYWNDVSGQITSLKPGEMKVVKLKDDKRFLDSTIIHNKRTGDVELIIFMFRADNVKYGESLGHLSLEFPRLIATFADGIQILKQHGMPVANVRIKADKVVNPQLAESLQSLGFRESKLKQWLSNLSNGLASGITAQTNRLDKSLPTKTLFLDIEIPN